MYAAYVLPLPMDFSVVWVEFDWDNGYLSGTADCQREVGCCKRKSCPADVGKPTLGPQSSILGEMLIIGLTADSTSMLDLRTIADWTIRPRLLSTGGVAQVAVLGGDIKEYQIQLDPGTDAPLQCYAKRNHERNTRNEPECEWRRTV